MSPVHTSSLLTYVSFVDIIHFGTMQFIAKMKKMQTNPETKDLETKMDPKQGQETTFANLKYELEHFLILLYKVLNTHLIITMTYYDVV